jgi:hypothetical protein
MLGVALLVGAVSAPPLIHPRPQISETPSPVKSAPLLPLTATSGPQGDCQYLLQDLLKISKIGLVSLQTVEFTKLIVSVLLSSL